MAADSPREATGGRDLTELFVDVREDDRLTLTYRTPDDEERTARVEAVTDAATTDRADDSPAAGDVAFWVRDRERDAAPYVVIRYIPVQAGSGPTVRVHGHMPEPETTARIEYLGEVERAVVDERGGEEVQNG